MTRVQGEMLDSVVKDRSELRMLRGLVRHLTAGCDDDHCALTWRAMHERALLAEAKCEVLGTRLALADRALRSKQGKHQAAYTAACGDFETALEETIDELRRKGA